MSCDLDPARLERSLTYLVEHYRAKSLIPPRSGPGAQSERHKNLLATAVADFVEGAEDFCAERVAEIDRDLERRGAYTLSFLRGHFAKTT